MRRLHLELCAVEPESIRPTTQRIATPTRVSRNRDSQAATAATATHVVHLGGYQSGWRCVDPQKRAEKRKKTQGLARVPRCRHRDPANFAFFGPPTRSDSAGSVPDSEAAGPRMTCIGTSDQSCTIPSLL